MSGDWFIRGLLYALSHPPVIICGLLAGFFIRKWWIAAPLALVAIFANALFYFGVAPLTSGYNPETYDQVQLFVMIETFDPLLVCVKVLGFLVYAGAAHLLFKAANATKACRRNLDHFEEAAS